jgi:hypothetical protein
MNGRASSAAFVAAVWLGAMSACVGDMITPDAGAPMDTGGGGGGSAATGGGAAAAGGGSVATGGGVQAAGGGGQAASGGGQAVSGGGQAAGGGGQATGGGSAANLASHYPGDVGIENDPAVLWAEHFDEGSVSALANRYTQAGNTPGMQLVSDAPAGASSALRVTATSNDTGGYLYQYFPSGFDEIYVRYYIKYSNASYHHTTVNVGGINPANTSIATNPVGLCCTAPDGDKAFAVSAEVHAVDGNGFDFDFYNYWWEMKSWGDIVTPPVGATEPDPITGQLKVPAAGNGMLHGMEPILAFDRWYAIELHVKLNAAGAQDGLLGLWIDGQKVEDYGAGFPNGTYAGTDFAPSASGQPFAGMSYRITAALKVDYLWITHYATGLTGSQTSSVEYAQLVMATKYIGPMAP